MRARAALLALLALSGCRSLPPDSHPAILTTSLVPHPEPYCVFLPPTYATSSRRYPVLYFLHDIQGDRSVLFRSGAAGRLAAAMRAGEIPEFLVVCPGGDGSWFSNSYDGSRRYEDMIVGDLRREIEKRYRVLRDPRDRGITGISMGGYAAVKIALHHPDLYGSVSSLSGAVIPMEWGDVERFYWLLRWQIHRVFGKSPAANSLAENDVWRLVAAKKKWNVPFRVFLLGGEQDKYGLGRVALQYAAYLNEHGIRATARMEPGIHDWAYWKTAFLEIAAWHGRRFGE